jgi:endonuclease YncB( thermonuclease family)
MVLLVGLCLLLAPQADTLNGRVVGVADSDTITVLDVANERHKIRPTGIDPPEKKRP